MKWKCNWSALSDLSVVLLWSATGGEVQAASQHIRAAGGGDRQSGLVLPPAGFAQAADLPRPLPSAGVAWWTQLHPQGVWTGQACCCTQRSSYWYSKEQNIVSVNQLFKYWLKKNWCRIKYPLCDFTLCRCFTLGTSREWWSTRPACLPVTQRCCKSLRVTPEKWVTLLRRLFKDWM